MSLRQIIGQGTRTWEMGQKGTKKNAFKNETFHLNCTEILFASNVSKISKRCFLAMIIV